MRNHQVSALAIVVLTAASFVHAQDRSSGARQQPTQGAVQQQPQSQKPQPSEQQQRPQSRAQQRPQPAAGQSDAAREMMARLEQRMPPAQVRGERPVQVALVTSAARIASSPAQFYGVPVSVHAQVAERYNPHVFTLEQDGWWQFGDELIVLVPSPRAGAALDENDFVTVTGTVRLFVGAELERDYDWFDFDSLPDVNLELEGRPIIVADTARTAEGAIVAQPAQQTTRILVASAGEIADVPGRFYGRIVSVAAEVEDVWSQRTFTLDEDDWFAGPDVLVFNPYPTATQGADLDGDTVQVLGTVRPFIVSEFEADYDWFDAADYERFGLERIDRRPVIVASSIVGENNTELVSSRPDVAIDVAERDLTPRLEQWTRMAGDDRAGRERQERGTTGQTGQQPQGR